MAWTVEYSKKATSDLGKLDKAVARRVVDFMVDRVAASDNPRQLGRSLSGQLAGLWRYRVGRYRVICDIQDNILVVLVVRVAGRDQVYR